MLLNCSTVQFMMKILAYIFTFLIFNAKSISIKFTFKVSIEKESFKSTHDCVHKHT